MNITQYLFQSPSSSQVQIGRLDPSTKQDEKETTNAAPKQTAMQAKTAGEFLAPVTSAINVVTPTVNQNYLLDVYA